MKLQKIQEGKIKLYVPIAKIPEYGEVFYNPRMEFSRNISVAALQVFQKQFRQKLTVCDALAATGVRGLRYAKEAKGIKSVVLNDKNPLATGLIKRNVALNKLQKKCIANKEDANVLLHKNVFTAIDMDPFGTPNIFLDSAARSIYHKGFLAVTATDTAPLSGSYPETCFRKYGIYSMKTDYYSELGLRILISHIILSLAKRERAFIPLLSHATEHYFRVFGRIEHKGKIANLLKQFGYVMHCFSCGNRKFGELETECECGKNFRICGLIYLGKIVDKKFAKEVESECEKRGFLKEEKFLKQVASEIDAPFYYDLHYLGKVQKIKIPRIEDFLAKLRKEGCKASRTVFCPTAVRTDCKFKAFLDLK